jgi:hypothetical protein
MTKKTDVVAIATDVTALYYREVCSSFSQGATVIPVDILSDTSKGLSEV